MIRPSKSNNDSLFSFIPAIIFISDELIATYVRPVFGLKKYGAASTILGWLPNFNAGLGMTILGGIIVSGIIRRSKLEVSGKVKIMLKSIVLVGTLFLLIRHELNQKETGLYYDINDIYATIAASILGTLISLKR